MKILVHKFEDIISVDNLLLAWQEFIKGKRNKKDVQEFQLRLMDNIFSLHDDLKNHTYKHGGYRDRLLHHAVYRVLYPYFDKKFIVDSFSCRNNKGTHKALSRFERFVRMVSHNNTKTCWVLKCDIRKFFASVDQQMLVKILDSRFRGNDTMDLLSEIIFSFKPNGLPLGNLTSQLFANVYLNEFDQFVKHRLRVKYYIRYADDFVVLSRDKKYLQDTIPQIAKYLQNELKLTLHPDKVFIKTLCSGVDYLGWVNFKDHRVLRTKTKRKMLRVIKSGKKIETINSYLGLLKHGNAYKLQMRGLLQEWVDLI